MMPAGLGVEATRYTALAATCAQALPAPEHQGLLTALNGRSGLHPFRWVLTRGGWYRLGGVVTVSGARVADDLVSWAKARLAACGGDMAALIRSITGAQLLATRLAGRTHYFAAATGETADAFLQLEVEELQELTDRALLNGADPPEDLQALVDPVGHEPGPGVQLGPPRYRLRRLTDAGTFLDEMDAAGGDTTSVRRFLCEWQASSAARQGHFSEHWVLELSRHLDRYHQPLLNARPIPARPVRRSPPANKRPSTLAAWTHDFDREAGYPFAWYFNLVNRARVAPWVVETIAADLAKDYAYLPERDAALVQGWVKAPYLL
jgi:hypothetical protein